MFTRALTDAKGRRYLSDREPYRFQAHPDNRQHTIVAGDTLWGLAGTYFAPLPRACGYWWVIADFQPQTHQGVGGSPVHDPTLELTPGDTLVIPSMRVLTDIILSPTRRRTHG